MPLQNTTTPQNTPIRQFSRGYTMFELVVVLILLMGVVVPLVSGIPFLLSIGVAVVVVASLFLLVGLISSRAAAARVQTVQNAVSSLDPKQRELFIEKAMQETGKTREEVEAMINDFVTGNPDTNSTKNNDKDAS